MLGLLVAKKQPLENGANRTRAIVAGDLNCSASLNSNGM